MRPREHRPSSPSHGGRRGASRSTSSAAARLRFAFDDLDPGCPGCRAWDHGLSLRRVREGGPRNPPGAERPGAEVRRRAVGSPESPREKKADGVAPEGNRTRRSGAPRARRRPRTAGARTRTRATKPTGRLSSESLACRMECPLAFAWRGGRAALRGGAARRSCARFLTLGPGSVIARALHAQARHHAGLRRAEEEKSDAFSSSGNFFRRVDVSARWIDYDAVECVSPPKPTVDAEFAATRNVTGVADDCRVAVTNDGVHFDDAFYGDYSSDGSSSDASAPWRGDGVRVLLAGPRFFLETTMNPALEPARDRGQAVRRRRGRHGPRGELRRRVKVGAVSLR